MTTLSVDVPAHVSQLVVSVENEVIIEQLRQQIMDLKIRNVILSVELAAEREQDTVNTQMSGRSDQDRAEANTVLTLESEVPTQESVHAERKQLAANTQMSGRSDQDRVEANPVLTFGPECPQQGFVQIYCTVGHLRNYVNQIRTEISRFTPVYLKGDTDTEWYNFPETGYSVNRRNNGSWTNCTNRGLANHTFELFQTWNGRNGQANYLGTYVCLSVDRLSRKAFHKLPLRIRETVINTSGIRKYHKKVRSLYNSGKTAAVQISFKRVGYNERLVQSLFAQALNDKKHAVTLTQTEQDKSMAVGPLESRGCLR